MERVWDTPLHFIHPGQLEVHSCSLQEDPQEDRVTQMSVAPAGWWWRGAVVPKGMPSLS